ncbi:MAG: prolipoprotein diacylglyceryl transferase [Acidimicrobiales bacterium]
MIAAIPSPSFDSIGPFTLYGFCIALGVLAAVSIGQKRWAATGGDDDDIIAIALWAVPGGVVGARLYHVITDWHRFSDESFFEIFNLRAGGLGIPGGMFLGVLTGLWVAHRRGIDMRNVLDAVVPGLPLAQAIGRWGNWFNQEVFGEPTDLPWGLEIDGDHRRGIPEEFVDVEAFPTFHPTFLYESLWNFALVGVMLWIDRKGVLPRGRLIAVYLLGYGLGRLWIESVRIDEATMIAGLRVNIWMSVALLVGGAVVLLWPRGSEDTEDDSDAIAESVQTD